MTDSAIRGYADDPFEELQSTPAEADLLRLILGEELGIGVNRRVYVNKLDEDTVVKVELDPGRLFQNVAEWRVWEDVVENDYARPWLAPCREISPSGVFLIQERTTPIAPADFPDRVPNWLSDLKTSNWGMLLGRPVCHDYGLTTPSYPKAEVNSRFRA